MMIKKGKGKRIIPAPCIEGRDDRFHDGRNGLGGDELEVDSETEVESKRSVLVDEECTDWSWSG